MELPRASMWPWCSGSDVSWAESWNFTGAPTRMRWNCLPAGRCDMIVGLPHDSGRGSIAAWSVPYAGAQFGLVIPRGSEGIHSLAELRGKRVGIVTGTVALSETDHEVVRFKSREALLDGFKAAALDGAFLDADFAAWYLHGHPRLELKLVPEYVPRERWNMAVAVRAKDTQLLVEINRALGQLAETGELRKIYADHAVPFRPPFTGSTPAKGITRYVAADSRTARACREYGSGQFAVFSCEG